MAQFVKKSKGKTGGKEGKTVVKIEAPILNPAALKKERPQLPPAKLKICVIGPGAIGGLVAAYLKDKLRDVFVIGKPEQVRAIKGNGLRVEGVRGTVYLAIDAKEKLEQKVDLIILLENY